jgi:hypothetical protein
MASGCRTCDGLSSDPGLLGAASRCHGASQWGPGPGGEGPAGGAGIE